MTSDKNYIAIDIAKDSLQVQAPDRAYTLTYNNKGLNKLLKLIRSAAHNTITVCEATGGYERKLMQLLWQQQLPVALINPTRVRAFAKSEGLKAKTDPLDAQMLLRFAQQKEPELTPRPSPEREQLCALMDRLNHLTEMRAREKNRLANSPSSIHASIRKMLRFIQAQVKEIKVQIRELIRSNQRLNEQAQLMQAVVGVGENTAWSILAYLSEITQLNRNQLVALAGVAPYNRDSGKTKGKRKIQGGRQKLRDVLFMAAKTAATHNSHIKPYYEGIRARGKPYKWALTAVMRKLLIHLQVILKNYEASLA